MNCTISSAKSLLADKLCATICSAAAKCACFGREVKVSVISSCDHSCMPVRGISNIARAVFYRLELAVTLGIKVIQTYQAKVCTSFLFTSAESDNHLANLDKYRSTAAITTRVYESWFPTKPEAPPNLGYTAAVSIKQTAVKAPQQRQEPVTKTPGPDTSRLIELFYNLPEDNRWTQESGFPILTPSLETARRGNSNYKKCTLTISKDGQEDVELKFKQTGKNTWMLKADHKKKNSDPHLELVKEAFILYQNNKNERTLTFDKTQGYWHSSKINWLRPDAQR